ncbi:MAG: acyl-CoA dehydrogenase family protein [Pseudomonadales bacterium]|nr:acyl-CoA dehydrogenase family protein [Pseudomonadales bacterium]
MAIPSMNTLAVAPIPSLPDEVNEIRLNTAKIVSEHIIPNEDKLGNPASDDERAQLVHELRSYVKESNLWAPHLPKEYGGMGIGFLGHAYMNEILAWSPFSNYIFGVQAPTSGNQSVLIKYGTEEQKKKFLEPTIRGEQTSCFSMTEPDNPGSDPRSLQTMAVRDGDEWVINGRKWFTSNGQNASWALVMCRTEEDDGSGGVNEKMTQIIVPTDTPGFNIERSVPVWGHIGGSHCEITYKDVRVPLDNQLGSRGSGHAAAQDRLGAGRVYHCMNCVGQMWRAFDLMVKRATEREVHGGMLMTINCAEVIDSGADPRTEISAIKIFVPNAMHRVVDRAIQVHGAMGVSGDTPLAGMYLGARTLRIADGPDEVHRILIAKNVLKHYHQGQTWDFGTL